jgi:hypothetical protein
VDAATWKMISISGYFLAVVFFITAFVLFFKMNIRAIIGDLTGKTAARQIQEIRERNKLEGNNRYKPAAFHLDRGTLTETSTTADNRTGRKMGKTAQALAHASKRLDLKAKTGEASRPLIKEKIDFHQPESLSSNETCVIFSEAFEHETEILGYDNRTELLSEDTKLFGGGNDTEVLLDSTEILDDGKSTEVLSEETKVLGDDGTEALSQEDEKTLLDPTGELEEDQEKCIAAVEFKIVKDIKIIHTSEVI